MYTPFIVKKPLFSILVASYNRRPYIEDSLVSALAQDYENIEIIVVDDGSTDNTLKIVKQMASKDKRIKVFENDKNMGCGYTKNRCGYEAKGEICGYLDPDDILEENAVSTMINAHTNNNDCSLIYSKKRFFYDLDYLNFFNSYNSDQIPEGFTYLTGKPYSVDHFASFKKSSFLKMGGISIDKLRAVDQDLYYRLEEVGKILFIDKYLYRHRVHDNGLSTRKNRSKAFLWHILVAREACMRRRIPLETVIPKLIDNYELGSIYEYKKSQYKKLEWFCTPDKDFSAVATEKISSLLLIEKNYYRVVNSLSFKLGRFITFPARVVRSLIRG